MLTDDIQQRCESLEIGQVPVEELFPELVCKCYSREKLARLYFCREAVNALPSGEFRDFAKLGLTNLLRAASDVAAGWPYVAPQKPKSETKTNSSRHVNIAEMLRGQLLQMYGDVQAVCRERRQWGRAVLIEGDARSRQSAIEADSVDIAFTSPPYLNNYDYADRTRLETYFWGEAKTWADITERVRTRLITSATTQINRSDYDERRLLSRELQEAALRIAQELSPKVANLSARRLTKGGKKSYDILVAGYFNDMLRVLQESFRILKSGSAFMLILGDSAPYGVYIPTDEYLGEIGKAVGFANYEIEVLRTRGGKWKNNPQRHNVALRESILTLYKR